MIFLRVFVVEACRYSVSWLEELLWPTRVLHRHGPTMPSECVPARRTHLSGCWWSLLQRHLSNTRAAVHHAVGTRWGQRHPQQRKIHDMHVKEFWWCGLCVWQVQSQLQESVSHEWIQLEIHMGTVGKTRRDRLPNVKPGMENIYAIFILHTNFSHYKW